MLILLAGLLMACAAGAPARALPAFAAQTGQPCQTCHVGGFGPQLTPYGRNFKIGGYTQRATPFNLPVSAMMAASYLRTAKDQPPQPHYAANDNVTIDQIGLFLAGGLGQHLGGFAQVTYDGVARAFTWDNLDVRATTTLQAGRQDVVVGMSVNNNPTLSDPWNTLPAWGYPYTSSGLAPAPATTPLLGGALAQNTLGVTAYAWISNAFYVEAGGYGSPGINALRRLGADPFDPGDIHGLAPYARLAYQSPLAAGTAEFGAFAFNAHIDPGRDRTTGFTDRYTDLGFDGSYYRPLASGDLVTANLRFTHESARLAATCALAGADTSCGHISLNEIRADASYYWRNRVGGTVQLFDTSGSSDPVIYAGDRTSKPNSSGVMFQLDATPFGGRPQPMRRVNLRVGVQYTLYTSFNGASKNFDGLGADAADNDTLRVFTWFAF
ncbi:MAG: hypothetical protein JO303_11490 [Caulobacteraceae bacterium]|nr:hypothetical protein [Caulobacteraceae bacterium]